MPRRIEVEITGDSRQLERAFDRSARSAQQFNADLAVTTAKIAAGVYGLTVGLEGAAVVAEKVFGKQSTFAQGVGDLAQGMTALSRGNLAGFIEALTASSERARQAFEKYADSLKDANQSSQALTVAIGAEALGHDQAADKIREQVEALQRADAVTKALDFTQRQYNVTLLEGTNAIVAYKGAVDSISGGPRGPGARAFETPATFTPFELTPAQRTQLDLIGKKGLARIPGLRAELRQYNKDLKTARLLGEDEYEIREKIKTTEAAIADIRAADRLAREREAERLKREAADRARRAREAARAAELARQLRVIEGPIPTPANLRRQLEQLQARIAGGEPVPRKTRDRLAAIGRLLGGGGEIYEETREGIRDYFRMVREEFTKGGELLQPVATRALNTRAITAGLGLTGPQGRLLRGRLSTYNIAGRAIAQTDVYMDGQKVGHAVKRFAQNDRIHSPTQKRGPNAGR